MLNHSDCDFKLLLYSRQKYELALNNKEKLVSKSKLPFTTHKMHLNVHLYDKFVIYYRHELLRYQLHAMTIGAVILVIG
jgi:hypothetical protein